MQEPQCLTKLSWLPIFHVYPDAFAGRGDVLYNPMYSSLQTVKTLHTLGLQEAKVALGRSRFRDQSVADPRPHSTEEPPCIRALCTLKMSMVKRPFRGVFRE
ncbi:hypothetical protein AVEN_205234-1 [Araneus ventricosus]|uniref:Uncharacterized protein n=1 Tax=Araneus ventricosus TaxID=182803 RepID=A0A4Y2IEX7_ARAVE|nr:hypothetical protein AVEN_205234-1 [Araneus ventricosus]